MKDTVKAVAKGITDLGVGTLFLTAVTIVAPPGTKLLTKALCTVGAVAVGHVASKKVTEVVSEDIDNFFEEIKKK